MFCKIRCFSRPEVYDALSTFRASGRFFWPAYYVIMAAVLAGTYSAFGRPSPPVLLAAFLIQVVDLAPLREWQRAYFARRKNLR